MYQFQTSKTMSREYKNEYQPILFAVTSGFMWFATLIIHMAIDLSVNNLLIIDVNN